MAKKKAAKERKKLWFESLPEDGSWAKSIADEIDTHKAALDREIEELSESVEYRLRQIASLSAKAAYQASALFTKDEIEKAAKDTGTSLFHFNIHSK